MSSQQIYVSISLGEETHRVGKLYFHQRGTRQSASFEYDTDWLKHSEKFALDPALQLTSGAFHTTPDQILFGAIGDSAPDRWGRVLMRRAESARPKASVRDKDNHLAIAKFPKKDDEFNVVIWEAVALDYDDPTASIDLALSVIDDFRIMKARAHEIIKEVALAVSEWRSVATQFGLIKREIERMASAF